MPGYWRRKILTDKKRKKKGKGGELVSRVLKGSNVAELDEGIDRSTPPGSIGWGANYT